MVECAVACEVNAVSNMGQNSMANDTSKEHRKEIDELPLMKVSSFMGSLSMELLDALTHHTPHLEAEADADSTHQAVPSTDTPVEDRSPSRRSSTRAGYMFGMPPTISRSDVEKALSDGHIAAKWEPSRWKRIKTLAPAAAGEGTVELMASEEQEDLKVAVKRLPHRLIMSCPKDFDQAHPKANEKPWMDLVILQHLNILDFPCAPKLLGVFQGEDQVHIMTSFANRGDLFSWWEADTSEVGMAREATIHPIVSQICAAVCWLHNLGIAHRDISVENVLLCDSADSGVQVQIIDFAMSSLSRTAKREVRGKRSYQAPEMHGPAEFDLFLTDIFAVGVIAYFMAVHSYPWEHTKPGKDPGFEFARQNGLDAFLSRKRMPCNKKPIDQVFTEGFVEVLCGLLAIAPDMRYSLGETCYDENPLKIGYSKSSFSVEADAASDVSTTDSYLSCARDAQEGAPVKAEQEHSTPSLDEYHEIPQSCQSRISVWDCQWIVAQDHTTGSE